MITTDPKDPKLHQTRHDGQREAYLVLTAEERAQGFVRPLRRSYIHEACGTVTTVGQAIAETYARDPSFYDATYCATCQKHFRTGAYGEFVWTEDRTKVGT